jgi:cytochrome c peroxidase
MSKNWVIPTVLCLLIATSCRRNSSEPGLTPYKLIIPSGLPAMQVPADNPLTEEGVELGRRLFYDPILSGNNTISCASCHKQEFAFTDSSNQFSIGIDGVNGTRNAMPIMNLGYQRRFFWDGGAADLESQVIGPIQNPVEMHEDLKGMIAELNAHKEYPELFNRVFGSSTITTPMVMRAIAQFERTLISGNSKFDQVKRGEVSFTTQEARGRDLFETEEKGDCTHCHSLGSTFSDFEFRNTGLDSITVDAGRAMITFLATDSGKFKTPSLRNIALTAPYMHDGRFRTLEECIDHYNTNFRYTKNLDGSLGIRKKGQLNTQEKADLIAFLHTLTDHEFITNPKFAKPQ